MKRFLPILLMTVLVSSLIFGGSARSATAPGAADFFKKNVVTMVIGFNPGGGSDYAGRLLASYWSAATDGGAMIIRNMTGAGGLVATNYINVAKPDGLTIGFGMFGNAYLWPHLAKEAAAKFDIHKLNWLVGIAHEPFGLHVSTKRPYETVADLKKAKGLKFATLTPFGPDSMSEVCFIDFLGLDARLITGYKGGSEMALAAGKGEIDVVPLPTGTGLDAVKKGFVKPPLVIMGPGRIDPFKESAAFPELVKITSQQETLFKMADMASYILRVGAAPPGVPEDRVKFMREAFAKIVAMDGFKEQSKLSFPLGPTPVLGNELEGFITEAANMKIDPLKALISKYLAIK